LTFDYQMEFVGNKKTACFCGTAKCSGLIGEKPKEEKRPQQPSKKKTKKRSSVMKLTLQPPAKKQRRTLEEMKDPIQKMLELMPERIFSDIENAKETTTEPEVDQSSLDAFATETAETTFDAHQ
jgi:hypothetical protein